MIAVVETGGKQYKMAEGKYVDIELLDAEEGDSVELDKVVMIIDGENSTVGQPYIEGAAIKGKVTYIGRQKKVLVYKMRCKKGYRKKQGHRQDFTRFMVESITIVRSDNTQTKRV
jgi:large subunit ribosomal protein L21